MRFNKTIWTLVENRSLRVNSWSVFKHSLLICIKIWAWFWMSDNVLWKVILQCKGKILFLVSMLKETGTDISEEVDKRKRLELFYCKGIWDQWTTSPIGESKHSTVGGFHSIVIQKKYHHHQLLKQWLALATMKLGFFYGPRYGQWYINLPMAMKFLLHKFVCVYFMNARLKFKRLIFEERY